MRCPLYRSLTFTFTFTSPYPRVPTLPSQDVHSAPAACLGAALVLSLPLWLLCNVAAKTRALQEEDETLMHEERWKMTLDGVGDWRRHAAMADVADQVRRRNAKAWPTFGGRRVGPGTATASSVLCLFLLAAFLAVAALDVGGGPKEGTSGDQLRDYVEVNFAYSHKYAQALMDRLLNLADNVTETRTGRGGRQPRDIPARQLVAEKDARPRHRDVHLHVVLHPGRGDETPAVVRRSKRVSGRDGGAQAVLSQDPCVGHSCAPTGGWAPTTPRRVGARIPSGTIPRWVKRGARRWRRRWTRGA